MFITECNERENSPQSVYDIRLTFIARDAMRKLGLCCRPVSVRPSVTLVYSIHTTEDIVKLLYPPDPITLVFWIPGADTQFQGEPIQRGRKVHGGGKNLRFSTEIAVYFGNGTR